MKYPWWERWGSLTLREYPGVAINKVTAAIDMAGWFVEHHAIEAEAFGWRPVHIMRPGGGLAWRWWSMPAPHLSIEPFGMVAHWPSADFAYRPRADGGVVMLTGPDRESVIAHV